MAEHSIVQSAKQGDPKAIAYLITHSLQKHGITARASRKGLSLKLLLEAEQVPHQSTMVKLVSQGMQKLNIETLQIVKLYGRQLGQPVAAWRHVIELLPQAMEARQSWITPAESQLDLSPDLSLNGAGQDLEAPLFQMEDLDPDAMILLPIDPELQLDDLDPDSLILFPVEPLPVDEPVDEPASVQASDQSDQTGDQENERHEYLEQLPEPSFLSQPDLEAAPPTDAHELAVAIELAEPSEEAIRPAKLPQNLTLLLLCLLWFALLSNTLGLVVSLLKAISFSLYAGLDLSSTNQPFAGLLLAIVGLASFIFTPFSRLSLGLTLVIVLLSLWWLHKVHASLRNLLGSYPISPRNAVLKLALPIYQIWGLGQVWFTWAQQLVHLQLKQSSRLIRRLTVWLYLALIATAGLQLGYLLKVEPSAQRFAAFFDSFWFDVARDTAIWIATLVWLRLVRITWRALRQLYRSRMAPFLPARPQPRPERLSLSAILLGAGASLLSLGLFNCLLGLLAALVFLSNGLRPESIFPTFYDSESLLALVLLGSFFSIGLGGFLTAHLAHCSSWLHALGLGGLLTLIGLALRHLPLFPALAELPFWFQTASGLLIIPAALLGCGLRQWFRTL